MDNTTNIRFINLFTLFTKNFFSGKEHSLFIPGYQRGYKWAVKKHPDEDSSVEYFVKSLIENSKPNSNEFFLQGITVYEDVNKEPIRIEIVDGQQRITTLYLLLWCLNGENIKDCSLEYSSRKDTQELLNDLKTTDSSSEFEVLSKDSQDVTFVKEAILQIKGILKHLDKEQQNSLGKFIKSQIKVIYVPIRKEKIVSTFTLMNGAKAIMRQEELIKAELLKQVSSIMKSIPLQFDNLDAAFEEMRRYSALDWLTATLRSKYAREWDKWLQWWNQPDVTTYFGIDRRPLGLLLNYYLRGKSTMDKGKSVQYSDFKKLITDSIGDIFEELRKLQKQFEDIYDTPILYDLLGVALRCPGDDRYETIKFFQENLSNSKLLKNYTAKRIYGCSHYQIFKEQEFNTIKENFTKSVKQCQVYDNSNEEVFRLLLWLNIIQDIKLGRKFNFRAWEYRSLEHIYPKSKVYHKEVVDGVTCYRAGDGSPLTESQYMNKTDDVIYRHEIEDSLDNSGNPSKLTEHSVGNLVLLFTKNNSEFGNKPFANKKETFFNMDITTEKERKRVFESRSLIHSLSKFSSSIWGAKQIVEYHQEISNILKYGLENE